MVRKNRIKFNPNYAVHPGETLLETIDAMGISQMQLAERTGKTTKAINEIIKGKAAITPQTALQLERVLNIQASFWNSLQKRYDEKIAELIEATELAKQVEWLKKLPIKSMIKNNWLQKKNDDVSQLKEVLNFFGMASVYSWEDLWGKALVDPQFAFRKSESLDIDPFSVSAWLRKGEIASQKVQCSPFKATLFKQKLKEIKSFTLESPDIFISKLKDLCSEAGVAVVFVNELPNCHINGAARWLTPEKAMIQLSLRYKTDDHLWFTFFHEAAHILLHGKKELYIDYMDNKGAGLSGLLTQQEKQANDFASEHLLPFSIYNNFIKFRNFSKDNIEKFAKENGISPGIVVGRLQFDGLIPYKTPLNGLKRKYSWDKFDWVCSEDTIEKQ